MLEIYNTLTRKKEIFKPKNSENVKIYYCGPTVYNYSHIGNFRAYIFEDIVIKTLQFLGYKTNTIMNITDVDDKTIRESIQAKMSLKEFTQKYTNIFLTDLEKL
jgi:cysteinyl-tRNA synthetase